jgi:hypothetical protein
VLEFLLVSKCISGYGFHTCTLSFQVRDHAFQPHPKQHENVVLDKLNAYVDGHLERRWAVNSF